MEALRRTWTALGGDANALEQVDVDGRDPILPSTYAVGTAAAASIAASLCAADAVWRARGGDPQHIALTIDDAVRAFHCERLLRVDGKRPGDIWSPTSGFYRTGDDGWIQLHTNFEHHLERTIEVLGTRGDRDAIAAAITSRGGADLERDLADAGACAAMARTRDEWVAHEQGIAVASLPLLDTLVLDDAAARELAPAARPLEGIRVLDLTRVLAGPVATRAMAAHGADVLRVSSRALPEIDAVLPDTSHGKRSIFVDLHDWRDHHRFADLVRTADVIVQSYRPGALATLGFGPEECARLRPGIVYVSISAYSHAGPWASRRGYDSLVQTASGIALAEQEAYDAPAPRHLPAQVLDHGTGYLAAAAAMLALARPADDGGSRHVRCSLAQTREWFETLGRFDAPAIAMPDDDRRVAALPTRDSDVGRITYVPPAGEMSITPPRWEQAPVVPGSSHTRWH